MARIGFLGTGNMGQGMVRRLLAAGHRLSIFNRTPAKALPLAALGAELASTPAAATHGAAAVFAMVGDDGASRALWTGPEGALGALAPAAFVIECSTLSHDWVGELAGLAAVRGLRYIDCPVTGLPDAAARGELTLFVGAAAEDLAAVRALLEPLCREIIHFGGPGAGTAYKLMVNLMGSIQIAALAEGMLVAEAAGLALDKVAYALCNGAAASPQVIRNAGFMAEGSHDERIVFSGRWRLKDTLYGVRLAEKMGERPSLGHAAAAAFQRQVDLGFGEANESKVIEALRREAAAAAS
ncbi:MAG: NAD(P)-dependent oxidoreductase [Alphaproteobacteria bacterium]